MWCAFKILAPEKNAVVNNLHTQSNRAWIIYLLPIANQQQQQRSSSILIMKIPLCIRLDANFRLFFAFHMEIFSNHFQNQTIVCLHSLSSGRNLYAYTQICISFTMMFAFFLALSLFFSVILKHNMSRVWSSCTALYYIKEFYDIVVKSIYSSYGMLFQSSSFRAHYPLSFALKTNVFWVKYFIEPNVNVWWVYKMKNWNDAL